MPESPDSKLPDLRYIRELAKVFKQYELDEIEIETGDARMLLRRGENPVVSVPVAAPAPAVAAAVAESKPAAAPAPAPAVEEADYIISPFVGTFYGAPRPDAESFVNVGDKIRPGQTVCIVEAMKLFNEIEADFPCVIEECLAENGQPVEYGANLFRVRKL